MHIHLTTQMDSYGVAIGNASTDVTVRDCVFDLVGQGSTPGVIIWAKVVPPGYIMSVFLNFLTSAQLALYSPADQQTFTHTITRIHSYAHTHTHTQSHTHNHT